MLSRYINGRSPDNTGAANNSTTTNAGGNGTGATSIFSISHPAGTREGQITQHIIQLFGHEEELQETPSFKQIIKLSAKQIIFWIVSYIIKFFGLHEKRPKRIAWQEYFWSFIGAFAGILIVSLAHYDLLAPHNLTFLIGSFGASAVLIYGAPSSPLAQPRNVVGGHFVSAVVGCAWRVAIDRFEHSVTVALAVATSIVAMQFTETVHPPGGATALIAVTTQPQLPWANFLYVFMPVLTGSIIMLIVALVINNLSSQRTFPSWWW